MLTVTFLMVLAAALLIACFVTVIHRIFISLKMSDKYYKNLGLALLCLMVYVSGVLSIYAGILCDRQLIELDAKGITFEKVSELSSEFIRYLDIMTIGLLSAAAFYLLTLLLVRSILKDIDKELKKPKMRWGKLEQKSAK